MTAPAEPRFADRIRDSFSRRRAVVARAEVYALDGKHVATRQQTLMMLADTPDTPE